MSDGSVKISRLPMTGQSIVDIYFDEKRKMLYWSDVDNNVIWRGKLDGKNSEIFIRYCSAVLLLISIRKHYFANANRFSVVRENIKSEVLKEQTELARSLHKD